MFADSDQSSVGFRRDDSPFLLFATGSIDVRVSLTNECG